MLHIVLFFATVHCSSISEKYHNASACNQIFIVLDFLRECEGCNSKSWFVCSYLCRTDPADVARVESKTWIATDEKYETVPHVRQGVRGILGQWKHTKDLEEEVNEDFEDCMAGECPPLECQENEDLEGYMAGEYSPLQCQVNEDLGGCMAGECPLQVSRKWGPWKLYGRRVSSSFQCQVNEDLENCMAGECPLQC